MKWVTSMVVGFAILAGAAIAADACFCLGDKDDATWYDCQTFRTGVSPYPQYECRPEPDAERVVVKQGHTLQQYEAGKGPCVPCKVVKQETDDQLRTRDSKETSSVKGPATDVHLQKLPADPRLPATNPAGERHE